jgi:flavin reductase (DIM6/NTAB) family NADH-FMN oxidoreductase RutF/DNA-binding GntR family transcriptional regulator
MCSTAETHPTIDERHFRRIVGYLASGVTIITTADGENRFGMTASSVTSLSADPALMLVCLNNAGPTAAAVARSGRYCVNILGEQNGGLAKRFAVPSEDKFQGVAVKTGLLGVPRLDEALAHIECQVADRLIRGTHSIFVGRVVAATARDGRPLTYFRGGFGRFALAEEDAAYRNARDLVLRRSYAAGDTVDIDVLAEALGVETASAIYALTRLEADGLVRREVDRGYVVTAFDTHTSDATFDARLIIELGVIEQVVGSLDQFQISQLRQRFEAMTQFLREDLFVDFDAYLEANYRFHETIIELAGNPLLTARFAELAIKQVMARSFGTTPETSQQFLEVQRRIVEAIEVGDKESARDAARSYSAMAKERARELFALHGDEL